MTFWEFILSHREEIVEQTIQHLILTSISMIIASAIGVSIGIFITGREKLASFILGFVGVIQTIPSLALLGFLLPIFGIGTTPAIIALFLYALLPIVRNTYTGIKEIDPAVIEASTGMGMTSTQLLRYVQLPLAFPIILAGIRTSTVINVGIATLCALIAAGGLGEFIFRGISLNNSYMILAGAIPASILAVLLDSSLGLIQKNVSDKRVWVSFGLILFFGASLLYFSGVAREEFRLTAGFNAEFIEREDGFVGLDSAYSLPLEIREMEIALIYQALHQNKVDLINGFSTDGKIREFDLKPLEDDKGYFPPYYGVPLINGQTLDRHPELTGCMKLLEGVLNDELMAALNYQVDGLKRPLDLVANEFLQTLNIYANPNAGKSDDADIVIGSKAFTENFLLAHIFAQLIENKTALKTKLELGFGGTKIIFDALRTGEIDLYPEYTGTGYLVLLQKKKEDIGSFSDAELIYEIVKQELKKKHDLVVFPSFGFNNTFSIMMRKEQADSLSIHSLSDLSSYLNSK